MATKKAAAKKPVTLYLHCLCETCTHWEIKSTLVIDEYENTDSSDELVCKTCGLTFPIQLNLPSRQQGIHWDTKE
jgi:uncharacterized protein YbaR (Trm112 family)